MAWYNQEMVPCLHNMTEFCEKPWQGVGVVVLQAESVTKGLAVLSEQLADKKAGAFLSPQQLDQLSCQGFDTLHFCQT